MKMKKIIVILGIDGSGKTTVAEGLKKKLLESGKTAEIVYMGLAKQQKIPLLKILMDIYFKLKWNGKTKKTTYTMERDWHRERGFFWLSVYFLELWAKYIFSVKKAKADYVLCDRYFYDGLVYANKKNFGFFRRFIPKPDASFLLCVPVKTIIKRKNEADERAIKTFYDKADKIGEYFEIKKIDNTKGIGEVSSLLFKEINNENKCKRIPKK